MKKFNSGILFFSVQYKVNCNDEYMTVDIKKTDDIKSIYLNQMKFYPGNILSSIYRKYFKYL